ncbi:MAG: hypothetical protein GTO13_18945 [Proteobacteria bacterium]|nr:hypothetical protein [Pseudomonadota bacterium]
MKLTDPLLNGSFTKRVNRFLVSVHMGERDQYVHAPNSGRMRELPTPARANHVQGKEISEEENPIRPLPRQL